LCRWVLKIQFNIRLPYRHTYVTLLREKGILPRDIQIFIDHADLSTTLGYAHEKSLEVLSVGIRRE
jgi:site-specific recombinase XerD